jgi:pimeloyl-ACP methyl ester carboxylesterase
VRRALPLLLLAAAALGGCVSLRPVASLRSGPGLAPEARLLPTSAGEVYLELHGPAGGRQVVLIHGFGSSLHSWRKVAPGLAAAGFRVLALDLPGFGYSARPTAAAAYTTEAQAALVAEVLDLLAAELEWDLEQGPGAVDLVGHSFGGGVALTLAASRPERVRSLVLVDSTLPTHSRARRADLPFYRPLVYLLIRTVGLRRAFVRAALERSFHDDSLVTRELVDAYRSRLLLRGPAGAYRSLTAPIPRVRLAVDLAAIARPALVVWGEEDALIPARAGRRAAERLPDARFAVLPACGHIPMEECPEAWLEAVLGFLGGPAGAEPVPPRRPGIS